MSQYLEDVEQERALTALEAELDAGASRPNRRQRRRRPKSADTLSLLESTVRREGRTDAELSEALLDRWEVLDRMLPTKARSVTQGTRTAGCRPRARRRRETRSSTRGAPPGDPEEPEPPLGGQQAPGEIIARLRVERGFSQEKAGVLAGLTQSGWSRIESGSSVGRPRARAEIADVLGVRVRDIWRPS